LFKIKLVPFKESRALSKFQFLGVKLKQLAFGRFIPIGVDGEASP